MYVLAQKEILHNFACITCCNGVRNDLELGTPMNASIAESDEVITRGWRDACIHNLSSLGLASLVLQAPHTP